MINESYERQLIEMHRTGNFNNGRAAYKLIEHFLSRTRPKSVLDFGCGHGALLQEIKKNFPHIDVSGYDPGNPNFSSLPSRKFDVLVSTDVLEHIEPVFLDNTLLSLSKLIDGFAFFRIACYPANKCLPDGRNAHLIVERPDWWRQKILATSALRILREKVTPVDKRDRWPTVVGQNYDVIVQSITSTQTQRALAFRLKYWHRSL